MEEATACQVLPAGARCWRDLAIGWRCHFWRDQ